MASPKDDEEIFHTFILKKPQEEEFQRELNPEKLIKVKKKSFKNSIATSNYKHKLIKATLSFLLHFQNLNFSLI